MTPDVTPVVVFSSVIVQSDELTAAEAQERFARDTLVTAIVLVDGSERVKGLLTRGRMSAAAAEGAALEVADTQPAARAAEHEPCRDRLPGYHARGRHRYDPVLVVDERWRLVEAISLENPAPGDLCGRAAGGAGGDRAAATAGGRG